MIFVDTGAWFARFVRDDPNHANVQAWFAANNESLVTTDYCVDETLTLLVARKRPKLVLEAGRSFFDEELAQLQFVTPNQVRRAWILFQKCTRRAGASPTARARS